MHRARVKRDEDEESRESAPGGREGGSLSSTDVSGPLRTQGHSWGFAMLTDDTKTPFRDFRGF